MAFKWFFNASQEKDMLNTLFKWISRTRLWIWVSKNIISKMTFRLWGYTKFPMTDFFKIQDILDKSRKEGRYIYAFSMADVKSVSSILIRFVTQGFYTHSGVIIDNMCYNMQASGIKKEHLLDVLKECDYFVIARFKIENETNKDGLIVAEQLEDLYSKKIKYDFQQELGNEYLYCSELVYIIGKDRSQNIQPVDILGRKAYEPDTILKQGEIIYEHGRV